MITRRITALAAAAILVAVAPASPTSASPTAASPTSASTPPPPPTASEPVVASPTLSGVQVQPLGPTYECAEADGAGASASLEAVITVPSLALVGSMPRVTMDQSVGSIQSWVLCVEEPDGTWYFSGFGDSQPTVDDWYEFLVAETGTYRLTLTVVDTWAFTHTVTESVVGWRLVTPTWP